jgi:hypothetical protein
VVHVSSFVFCAQDLHCLMLCDPPRTARVMFSDKAGKGLAYDQADIER